MMDNKKIMQVLVAIQSEIVTRQLESAYGRCAVLYQLLDNEIKDQSPYSKDGEGK